LFFFLFFIFCASIGNIVIPIHFFSYGTTNQLGWATSLFGFLDHTQTHTHSSERVISSLQMLLSTDTQQKQEGSVTPSKGFEQAILANERPQTYALEHRATGIGLLFF
jgi:hypothetical protein